MGKIDPAVEQLFTQRGISPSQLVQHVEHIHHKAFEIHPWPMIGGYHFLQTYINKQDIFEKLLPRLQHGDANILDLGCALGQDVRVLISCGVPPCSIYALDYMQDLWDVGFELFNDEIGTKRGMEEVTFRQHDFLQGVPEQWKGQMDVVFAGAFFHVFDYEDQVKASRNAAKLLKPQSGSLIFGYQLGRLTAVEGPSFASTSKSGKTFLHNQKSFEKLWCDIGEELNVQFDISFMFYSEGVEDFIKIDHEFRRIQFVVKVVS